MEKKIKNILIINSGGGFGDTVQFIPLLNYLNDNFPQIKIFYYANDYEKFYFDNQLKNFRQKNLTILKDLPIYFGFRLKHIFFSKKIPNLYNLNRFDLIIDTQTKIRNLLIYKKIPHNYFFSPTFNYFFCKPKFEIQNNRKHIIGRILAFFEIFFNKEVKLEYNTKINDKFITKANQLLPNTKKYIGLSLVSGHQTRTKEFNKTELVKIINHFKKKYTPVFFIEKNQKEMVNFIKENFPDAFFPEHNVGEEYNFPDLLVALSNLMEFNITIDNGVAHLLSLSKTKTFAFYPGNADKFKPLKETFLGYNCKDYSEMSSLSADKVINFIETNL